MDGNALTCTDVMAHCGADEEVQRRCCATCGALHKGQLQYAQGWISDAQLYEPLEAESLEVGRGESMFAREAARIASLEDELNKKDEELAELETLLKEEYVPKADAA